MARGRHTARDLAADSAYARADSHEQPTDLAILAYIPPKPNAEHKAALALAGGCEELRASTRARDRSAASWLLNILEASLNEISRLAATDRHFDGGRLGVARRASSTFG